MAQKPNIYFHCQIGVKKALSLTKPVCSKPFLWSNRFEDDTFHGQTGFVEGTFNGQTDL